jgi:large subunit ribosomal protein L30
MAKAKTTETASTIRVRLYKSINSCKWQHRLSVKALGLNKLNDVRELKDSAQVRGLVNKVNYLVRIEE